GSPALHVGECTDAHDVQRVATGVLADDGAPFDPVRVDAAVDAACADAAADLAGDLPPGSLGLAVTRPSAAGWTAGDRAYQCVGGAREHRLMGEIGHASRSD